MKKSLLLLASALIALAIPHITYAGTYTVNSLADSSAAGTLRWAIGQANANAGSTIDFSTAGTIKVKAALPSLTAPTVIDGSTTPGFKGSPVIAVNFAGQTGFSVGAGADGSTLRCLSLVGASSAGITLTASRVTLDANYIGLTPDGAEAGNKGDGVKIVAASKNNLIGNIDPVRGVKFMIATGRDYPLPVKAWQGLRDYKSIPGQFLICGTSGSDGLLYVGPFDGGGKSFKVDFPRAGSTSVYGPDNLEDGTLRLVGTYKTKTKTSVFNHGFVWEGTLRDLPSGGKFRSIDYPGATYQYTHSTMGDLAVGNADGPSGNLPIGPGVAYIYDVNNRDFVSNIVYPGSKSNSAYGIWYNGGTKYTICGGYSPVLTNNFENQKRPLAQGKGFLVDYDSKTKKFSHWASFDYQNGTRGKTFITHFEGISSVEDGVYTLSADSVRTGSSDRVKGSWVSVRRTRAGTFSRAQWVELHDPDVAGIVSSNSVYGNHVVGIIASSSTVSYQATINVGFQLSNVISGNRGNGIGIYGSKSNFIAQNYIGTNPNGRRALANGRNGILLTDGATANRIGGQEAAGNNPTGSEGKVRPVFIIPPQGNLISGNKANGVLISNASTRNRLSSNFIGTDFSGNNALGNGRDGVNISNSDGNALIGCSLRQNPFVFYNVVSGNGRDGIRIFNSDQATVRANFLGIAANNKKLVPNVGNGLTVSGTSKKTQVGGVIPLGNVISGNTQNGIAVLDTASGFISFNTFGGGFAFGGAAPNGKNGIYVTSTGGQNLVRTCILSGNLGNGVEICGDASGVQVIDTAIGTNTDINAALPNHQNGVLIRGTAHDNALGGFRPSVETRTHFAGNLGYGVAVMEGAHDNRIFNSNIGLGFAATDGAEPTIPNQTGGIFLDQSTSNTTIGGSGPFFANRINTNIGGGLTIIASTGNIVSTNQILTNTDFGLYATGVCTGTAVTGNSISGNGSGPGDDVDTATATGITVTP